MHARYVTIGGFCAVAPMTGGLIVKVKDKTYPSSRPVFECEVIQAPKDSGVAVGKKLNLTADRLNERRDIRRGFYRNKYGEIVKVVDVGYSWAGLKGGGSCRCSYLGERLTPAQVKEIEHEKEMKKQMRKKKQEAGVKAIHKKYPFLKVKKSRRKKK